MQGAPLHEGVDDVLATMTAQPIRFARGEDGNGFGSIRVREDADEVATAEADLMNYLITTT